MPNTLHTRFDHGAPNDCGADSDSYTLEGTDCTCTGCLQALVDLSIRVDMPEGAAEYQALLNTLTANNGSK